MSAKAQYLWINGTVQDAANPVFAITDRGVTLGDGLFETFKISNGMPCHFHQHWARLSQSAAFLKLPLPYDEDLIKSAGQNLALTNGVTDGAARLLLSRGPAERGLALPQTLQPVMVLTVSTGLPVFVQSPVLGLSSISRHNGSVACRHKTLAYIDNVAARLHQRSTDMREEVVMLDSHGHVASASAANVFWMDAQGLHTPSLSCAILPGTMRARVLACAMRLGLPVHEGAYTPDALFTADAAFMSNALVGLQKLGGVDFGILGQTRFTKPHPQAELLQNALTDP
jgi:branched-subunit amino acid aminotransferase/4-amino-4-deoxychorismate lyase